MVCEAVVLLWIQDLKEYVDCFTVCEVLINWFTEQKEMRLKKTWWTSTAGYEYIKLLLREDN